MTVKKRTYLIFTAVLLLVLLVQGYVLHKYYSKEIARLREIVQRYATPTIPAELQSLVPLEESYYNEDMDSFIRDFEIRYQEKPEDTPEWIKELGIYE